MRSFSLVDHKVAEAEFFLSKLRECDRNFFAVRCYVSAFAASARTVTFALQSVLSDAPGFEEWYRPHQERLKENRLARFFHEFRRINQHIGDNLVTSGFSAIGERARFWFGPTPDVSDAPDEDVETACEQYFKMILVLVLECYQHFGPLIDAHQRYTAQYFESQGRTIEDAEEEVGFPRGWTDNGDPAAVDYRWQALRSSLSGCEINHIFTEYLGAQTTVPSRLPPYAC